MRKAKPSPAELRRRLVRKFIRKLRSANPEATCSEGRTAFEILCVSIISPATPTAEQLAASDKFLNAEWTTLWQQALAAEWNNNDSSDLPFQARSAIVLPYLRRYAARQLTLLSCAPRC